MINEIKAEFKKLLTIRSTYIVFLICLAFVFLFTFYRVGFHSHKNELATPFLLADQVVHAVQFLSVIGSVVAVLAITHEYRYNIINYTFTLSKSRSKVLYAKAMVVTVYAVIFSAIFAILAPLLAYAGLHANGIHYAHQIFSYGSLAWRALLAGWAFFMLAFIFAVIIRNLIGAIVTALLLPTIISQLLGLIFSGNSKYLPYHALDNVLGGSTMSHGKAAILVLVYVIAGWLVGWYLLIKRDAS